MKPKCLDLFCGAGGASMGLHRAGFDVTGVDIKPQPRYPFRFIQGDALRPPVRLEDFDLVWASPPCQRYSICTPAGYHERHPNLIDSVRTMLRPTRLHVIENVAGARKVLRHPVKLCGSMFGLPVWRHRYFEANFDLGLTSPCNHSFVPVLVSGSPRRNGDRTEPSTERRREAMETPWMTRLEMDEAIPPAYSEHIGRYAMMALGRTDAE